MNKYELTSETLQYVGHTLYRIKALKDFGSIKAGQFGGWIESEENLSQADNAWVYNNAKVFDKARVYGQGEGLQGNAYALPTKDLRVKENRGLRSISKEDIIKSIKKLYETARQYSDKQFKIAYRNTYSASLNGYTGLEMIDMFLEAGPIPDNIIFSKEWIDTGKL